MNKVAVVSCYFHHNYGSVLQALATQLALDKLGFENETIDISGLRSEINKAKIKHFLKASVSSDILLSKYGMAKSVLQRKLFYSLYSQNLKIRNDAFELFKENNFRLSKALNSKEALSTYVSDNYSAVIVGSDQLWLPGNISADYYTLNWVPESVNTIAYATSFGQSILPKESARKARVFLKRIRHIGVREKSGQELVEKIASRRVPLVCDPTMLLTREDWMIIQEEKPLINEPYIFSYFLGNNPSHRDFVKKLKRETGYSIVSLVHLDEYIKEDESYADYTPYNIHPGEFLNLIRNARYVCTDSFHCSSFSILYEKEFYVFKRYTRKTNYSTNDRIITLLNIAGIDNRVMEGGERVEEYLRTDLDYSLIKNNIQRVVNGSYDYLIKSLDDTSDTDL